MALSSSSGAGDAEPLDKDAEIATLSERLRSAEGEKWTCSSCGCQFPEDPPALLSEGVTRCSKCVEVEVWRSRAARYEGALKKIADPLDGGNTGWSREIARQALSPVPGEGSGKEGAC